MKIKALILITTVLISADAYSQGTITGTFPALHNQLVKLSGFKGFDTYIIDSIRVNSRGNFTLSFGLNDYGMGYLTAEDNKSFSVILAKGENLNFKGETFALPETVVITSGKQNLLFEQYAIEHQRREQVLGAWDFLGRIYSSDTLFAVHGKPKNDIEAEKHRIKQEDNAFLAGLGPDTYLSWYLPVRKLVSSVSTIAQYRTEEIPVAIAAFRAMDYTDTRLYKSGLLGNAIESHFWLIENSGRSLDSVFIDMNISIDHIISNIVTDEKKFGEITGFLFKLLESRSLFTSSEYLALKVLNETSCTIDNDLAAQLENYRAMKIGNTASDFAFGDDFFAPGYEPGKAPQNLNDLKSKYTMVIFGASWCPKCPAELSQIARLYEKWQIHGVEVVFVSLDDHKQVFHNFAGIFPFISTCDFQKWESPVVKAWYVFATPTLYLLNDKREIVLRPGSVEQMDAWVDWYLVQGNK